jgi:cephalosporin-C deacetylase-like acetyl esterase
MTNFPTTGENRMKPIKYRSIALFLIAFLFNGCTTNAQRINDEMADLLFGYDKSLPLQPEVTEQEEATGYKVLKVIYRSSRDQHVPAFFILPKGKEGEKLPCVILMHGLGSDKNMFKMMWGTLASAGYALFAIDAQYHGERKPKDTSTPLFGPYPYNTRDALAQTVVDLRRGIDFLESRPEIDPSRIGYLGASMGGIIGSMFAGVDERVQAPVLLVAGGNWKIMMEKSTLSALKDGREKMPEQVTAALRALDPIDPIQWIGKISPRPVLFINGDADDVVPVASNKALHEAAKEPKQIVWYKGPHVPPPTEIPNILSIVVNWLNNHVKNKPGANLK